MGNFFLFLSDLFHQILFYFGGVFAMGILVIEKVYKPIPKKVLMWAAIVCLFVACFQCWIDEHKNTEQVIAEKATAVGLFNSCMQDKRVDEAYAKGESNLNATQRNTIDSQQQTINAQQRDVASCVISLGKMNPLLNTKLTALDIPVGWLRRKDQFGTVRSTSYFSAIVILTNRTMPPIGTLSCTKDFAIRGGPTLHAEVAGGMIISSPPKAISDHEYKIRIQDTRASWTPDNPIYLIAVSTAPKLEGCIFKPE